MSGTPSSSHGGSLPFSGVTVKSQSWVEWNMQTKTYVHSAAFAVIPDNGQDNAVGTAGKAEWISRKAAETVHQRLTTYQTPSTLEDERERWSRFVEGIAGGAVGKLGISVKKHTSAPRGESQRGMPSEGSQLTTEFTSEQWFQSDKPRQGRELLDFSVSYCRALKDAKGDQPVLDAEGAKLAENLASLTISLMFSMLPSSLAWRSGRWIVTRGKRRGGPLAFALPTEDSGRRTSVYCADQSMI